MCLFFLQLQWLLSYWQFCDFSQNKSCKTYLGKMLPSDGRIWLLNSPHQTISTCLKQFSRGVRYLTAENLEVVWAEFSTLSQAVLFQSNFTAWRTLTTTSRVENSAQVSSCQLKFVHGLVDEMSWLRNALAFCLVQYFDNRWRFWLARKSEGRNVSKTFQRHLSQTNAIYFQHIKKN